MENIKHLIMEELEAGLEIIKQSPKDHGLVELIVRRPEVDQREVLTEAKLDTVKGLIGDSWLSRGNPKTPDGLAHPEKQINIMNSRSVALIAQNKERWPLAGDQFYIDLDLGLENLPPGTRLTLGTAIIEVTPPPHTGCHKFVQRFGADAMKFVNSPVGRQLNLRGINAKIIQSGVVRTGDSVSKV